MQILPLPRNSGRLDKVNNIDLDFTTVQSVSVLKQINEFWKTKTKTKTKKKTHRTSIFPDTIPYNKRITFKLTKKAILTNCETPHVLS